jgi:hypothetical protein
MKFKRGLKANDAIGYARAREYLALKVCREILKGNPLAE